MRCHECSHVIVVKTDPKSTDFIVDSGAQKKNEDYKAEDAEAMKLQTYEHRLKNKDNGFLKLEQQQKDKQIGVGLD